MKKFLPLFVLALWCTGASADIQVSTNTESPENVYKIRGGRANTGYYWTPTGANVSGAVSGAEFAFYKVGDENEGVYYIYCVTDETYLGYSYSNISSDGKNKAIRLSGKADSCRWKITACTSYTDYFQLQPIGADGNAVSLYANWHAGVSGNTSIGLWTSDGSSDAGSAWTFCSVADITCTLTAEDNTSVTYTKRGLKGEEVFWQWEGSLGDIINLSEEVWDTVGTAYTAKIGTSASKYMYGSPSGVSCYLYSSGTSVKTQKNALPTNNTHKNWEWQFVPTVVDETLCFRIKNMNEEKYIVTSSSTTANLTLGEESSATEYVYGTANGGYGFSDKANPKVYISVASSGDGEKNAEAWVNTKSGHAGVKLTFVTPADFDDLMTKLTAANTTANAYAIGSDPGQYTATAAFTAAKTKAAAIIAEKEYAKAAEFTTYTSNLSTSNLTLNVPQAGKFYTLQETTGSYHLTPLDTFVTSKNQHRLAMSKTASEENRVFYFNGSCLMGYSNGYFVVSSSSNMLVQGSVGATSGAALSFSSGDTSEGSLVVRYNSGNRTLHGGFGYSDGAGSNQTGAGYRFYVREVTDLPLTIGTNGWSTFSAPVAVTVPSGVTAYYAPSAPTDGKLVLEEVTGAVPANTGIIVRGTEGTTVNFSTVTTDTEEATVSGNLLQSNVSVNSIEGASGDGKYALATNTTVTPKVTGFMKLNTTITLPGHKCWLQTSTSASSGKFLPIALTDDPTGIETAETAVSDSDAPVYDLQGRKVASTRKGGMYIQNGKVFIAM